MALREPFTCVKSPPMITFDASAVSDSAFTSASADGAQDVSAPVPVAKAARRVRAAPPAVVKSPAM
jgi:hypothetical protein